jgi:septal ring factor EnvC (AmiA/AmiB activator)
MQMGDETIARLFARVDDIMSQLGNVREAQSRLEERMHYTVNSTDDLRKKLDEALSRINSLEDEITAFKWWARGAYVALTISAGTLLWVLTRTGVLSRVFGD